MYFCGFTSQLKMVIDRFYSFNVNLRTRNLKVILIATSADKEDWTMDAVKIRYDSPCCYIHFQDCRRVLVVGCDSAASTSSSKYMDGNLSALEVTLSPHWGPDGRTFSKPCLSSETR